MSFKNYIKKNKKKLRKRRGIIVFLSILAILGLTTATYAWFTVNTFAGIERLELRITTGEQLLVSMQDHGTNLDQYTDTITNEMIDSYLQKYDTSLDKMLLNCVTTNNGSDFTFQNGKSAEPNGPYLEFECYFIATCDMYVHLTTEGGSNHRGTDGTKVESDSPSPQNDIVRAIRIDFQTARDLATYEPNKGNPSTRLTTFDLPSGAMNYDDSNRLFHLDELTPTKATIRLWLEGEDPEGDDDVKGADLAVQLSFVGCDENGNPIS